jgi:hypothetical protein
VAMLLLLTLSEEKKRLQPYTRSREKLLESYKGLEKTSFTLQIIILKDKIKTIGDSKNKKRGDGCCIL